MIVAHVWEVMGGIHLVMNMLPTGGLFKHSVYIDFQSGEYSFMVYKTRAPCNRVVGEGIAKDEDELQAKLKSFHVQFARLTLDRLRAQRLGKRPIVDEEIIGDGTMRMFPMKCGHVSSGFSEGKPICVICNCWDVDPKGEIVC